LPLRFHLMNTLFSFFFKAVCCLIASTLKDGLK
jgi:hypothetical protein